MSKELEKLSISLSSQPNVIAPGAVPSRPNASVRSTLLSSILDSFQKFLDRSSKEVALLVPFFQHHERNLKLICLMQVVTNTAFCLDVFLNMTAYEEASLSSAFGRYNLTSASLQCTWIWLLHGIFFVLVSCTYMNPKYHASLVYPLVLLCVVVSLVLILVAGVYYLLYGSLWANNSTVCSGEKCLETKALRDYGTYWCGRTLIYIFLQWIMLHPLVSYLIMLLKKRKEVDKTQT